MPISEEPAIDRKAMENAIWQGIEPFGDLYVVQCGASVSYSGNWSFENNALNLNRVGFSAFSLSGDTLRESINEDLPGIQSFVYTRQ